MKNVAIALTVVAGLAAGANAQSFDLVVTSTGSQAGDYLPGETINYSVFMDNTIGIGAMPFYGWASFAGKTTGTGIHTMPNESPLDQTFPDSGWEGRRPASNMAFDGGTNGGFRFVPQFYGVAPDMLEGMGGVNYEGLAASMLLGGFGFDESPRLEVFRGSLIATDQGMHDLMFQAADAAYFADPGHMTTISAGPLMGSQGDTFTVVPAPGSLALLGMGTLAMRRRR